MRKNIFLCKNDRLSPGNEFTKKFNLKNKEQFLQPLMVTEIKKITIACNCILRVTILLNIPL